MPNLFAKQINLQRKFVKRALLPMTCKVFTRTGTSPVISGAGILTSTKAYRTYEGSQNIPCRVDLSRAFRPGTLPNQITAADEFVVEFPHDFFFEETDRVEIGSDTYIIRKTATEGDWLVTHEAVISQLGVNSD